MDLRLLIFFNHQLSREVMSGGEKMFLEVSKRYGKFGVNASCAVPEIAVEELMKEGLRTRFFTIPCLGFEYNSYKDTAMDALKIALVFTFRTIYCSLMIFKCLKESRADCVYSTGDFIPDTVPAMFARLLVGIKWIAVIHHIIESPVKRRTGSTLSNTGAYLMQRFSFILIKYFAAGVFVKNEGVRGSLLGMGFKEKNLFIIDNGVDLKRIEGMPSDYPRPFDACYIGRLSASKGVGDLINIWGKVIESLPEARLAIIGGGSRRLEEEKRETVREMNLERNIEILGSLSDEEAYRVRKTSKLSLSCSYEEGWGITIAESLACGVPCIVYNLPVYEEKFAGAVETVPKGDFDAFAGAVVEILKDKGKRDRLSRQGREVVKNYDIDNVVRREAGVIKGICSGLKEEKKWEKAF